MGGAFVPPLFFIRTVTVLREVKMDILQQLSDKNIWLEFYNAKSLSGHMSLSESEALLDFINAKAYSQTVSKLQSGVFFFSVPEKKSINKMLANKKRIVYIFPEDEMYVMKLLCYLLYKYDDKLTDSCYSFRRGKNAKTAVRKILSHGMDKKYSVKADISNYFNSIPSHRLAETLKNVITDDPALLRLLQNFLTLDKAYENGRLIAENRGAMAGCPLSPFFANFYLNDIDKIFEEKTQCFCRYSDDILFFADTQAQAEELLDELKELFNEKGLFVNTEKCMIRAPEDGWEFLGFAYKNGCIDISPVTKRKIKAKIKRKAKALYRWSRKKNLSYEKAARAMIKRFNKKFYDDTHEGDFSWSRWFFPILTTSEGLKEVDGYILEYIRFLRSGRHYKGNYRFGYDEIKKLGYRSLVNEFYRSNGKKHSFHQIKK